MLCVLLVSWLFRSTLSAVCTALRHSMCRRGELRWPSSDWESERTRESERVMATSVLSCSASCFVPRPPSTVPCTCVEAILLRASSAEAWDAREAWPMVCLDLCGVGVMHGEIVRCCTCCCLLCLPVPLPRGGGQAAVRVAHLARVPAKLARQ